MMSLESKTDAWTPLPKRIATEITELVAFRSDALLPSERKLSSLLGVSRSSVREALALLESAGKLRTRSGRGRYWVTISAATTQSPDGHTWYEESDKGVVGQKIYLPSEIFQLRYQMEGECCRAAAQRITQEEIEQLEENMRAFKEQTRTMDLKARAKTDFHFHHLIVKFSGIQLFIDLQLLLRDMLMKSAQTASSQHRSTWQPVAEHENITEALKQRDPDEALYFMQSHVVRSACRLCIAGF